MRTSASCTTSTGCTGTEKLFLFFRVSFFFTQHCNLFVVVVFNAELAVLLETEMRE